MHRLEIKSELGRNTAELDVNKTHDIFQYSIDADRSVSQHHNIQVNQVQSLKISNRSQHQDTSAYKIQLIKLMALVKLEQLGYMNENVKTLLSKQILYLTDMANISSTKLDQQASNIVDNVLIILVAQNGVRVRPSSRANSMERQSNQAENESPQIRDPTFEHQHPQILCSICYLVTMRYCEQKCMHSFCESCMRGYVNENISTGNYIIKCPQYDCPEIISLDTIKHLLQPRLFQRYLHFKQKNELEMNPDNKFCHKPDCGQLLTRAKLADRLVCPKCQSAYCQICLQDYHEGKSCDIILKNALQSTYKIFKIKKCPNCKSPIEKYEGCNHINCKKCKHEFCWLCLSTYSRHHYRYYNCFGCPGMQFQNEEVLVYERCKQFVIYLLAPFVLALVLLCYLAVIPLFMFGNFIYKPFAWINKGRLLMQGQFVDQICCCLGECIQSMILWLLFQPRAILYAVFVAPVNITAIFCGQLCRCFQ